MREGWIETTLGDLADWSSGKNISKNSRVSDGQYSIIGANGEIGRTDQFLYDQPLVVVGRVGSCGETYLIHGKVWISDNALIAFPNANIEIKYLYYLLKTFDYNKIISGTTQPLITQGKLKTQSVFIPPLPEQKRIVDLISSVDSYIEALQQQLESAKRARNAVLHELLTAGGDDWLRASLSEICTMIKRGQAPAYTEQKSVTVLNQKCVRNGRIQFEFARQTDSNIKPINEWAYLKAEDTLVNSTGVGTLGRVAFVGVQDEPLTVDSHLTIVRPDKNKIQPSFLGLSLNFREADIEGLAAGSSGQTELSREALGNLIITIPPIQEQKRIVEIISAMDTVVNQTELAITEGQNLRSGLLSDLLSGTHEIPGSYDKVMGAA